MRDEKRPGLGVSAPALKGFDASGIDRPVSQSATQEENDHEDHRLHPHSLRFRSSPASPAAPAASMPRLSSSRSIVITTNYCVATHGRDIQQLDMQEAVYTSIVSCLFRRKPNASYIGPVAIFEATHGQ